MTAPAFDQAIGKLRAVRNLESLTAYLRDELEWPIADWDIEDLTFEYTPEDAGLDPQSAVKVRSIRRLRPIVFDQPWGIFFIDFFPGDLPITVLRRILRTVVVKKRSSNLPDRQTWQMDDLLFISVLGDKANRDLNLAHFSEGSHYSQSHPSRRRMGRGRHPLPHAPHERRAEATELALAGRKPRRLAPALGLRLRPQAGRSP